MNFLVATIWTPGELHNVQRQLAADAVGVDQTVKSCSALSAATRASWEAFYAELQQFTAIDFGWFSTTGTYADQAQLLQRRLYAWEQKLSGTCQLTVPLVDPTTNPNNPINGPMIVQALKYGAVIAGFLGSAYIVGKTLEWLPKPPAREKQLPARR